MNDTSSDSPTQYAMAKNADATSMIEDAYRENWASLS